MIPTGISWAIIVILIIVIIYMASVILNQQQANDNKRQVIRFYENRIDCLIDKIHGMRKKYEGTNNGN